MKKILFTLLSAAVAVSAAAGDKNYLRYVDPYIGAGGHGHVFVGACVPFGAIQIGPQNIFKGWDWCSGYHYSDNVLIGFSHTHLSGTGCTDLGDIQIMPFTGEVRTRRGEQDDISNSCSAHYQHENERVSPYFYSLTLDNGIHAAPAAGNKHAAAKNDGPKKEDNKTMTLEEMRAQHPDVVAQIEQQAAETARTQERARIEAIDSIAASVGDTQLVRDAKYGETPCTAEQLALKAMQKQAALGAKHLKDAKADNDESGAAGVGAAPNGGEEGSENDDKAKVDAIVGLYNSTKSQNGGKK